MGKKMSHHEPQKDEKGSKELPEGHSSTASAAPTVSARPAAPGRRRP